MYKKTILFCCDESDSLFSQLKKSLEQHFTLISLYRNHKYSDLFSSNVFQKPSKCTAKYFLNSTDIIEKTKLYRQIIERTCFRNESWNLNDSKIMFLIRRVENFVLDSDFKFAIFASNPHFLSDLVLYDVLKKKKIPTLILEQTGICDYVLFKKDILGKKLYKINQVKIKHLNLKNSLKLKFSINYIKVNKGLKRFLRPFIHLYRLLYAHYLKNNSKEFFCTNTPSLVDIIISALKVWWQCRNNRMVYNRICDKQKNQNYKSYIYFPLHYQPERTSTPDAFPFDSQQLALNFLCEKMPEEISVAVKEHPRQLEISGDIRKLDQRDHVYYLSLLENKRTVLLDFNKTFYEKDFLATATLTGSAGWQAICCGKPVLLFGNAWYARCKAALQLNTKKSNRISKNKIANHLKLSKNNIKKYKLEFLKYISKYLIRGATRSIFSQTLSQKDKNNFYTTIIKIIKLSIKK